MAAQRSPQPPMLLAENEQPLISIVFEEDGREVVRHFASEEEADAFLTDETLQRALDMAGAWSDLDWDEMIEALDHIRHDSRAGLWRSD